MNFVTGKKECLLFKAMSERENNFLLIYQVVQTHYKAKINILARKSMKLPGERSLVRQQKVAPLVPGDVASGYAAWSTGLLTWDKKNSSPCQIPKR